MQSIPHSWALFIPCLWGNGTGALRRLVLTWHFSVALSAVSLVLRNLMHTTQSQLLIPSHRFSMFSFLENNDFTSSSPLRLISPWDGTGLPFLPLEHLKSPSWQLSPSHGPPSFLHVYWTSLSFSRSHLRWHAASSHRLWGSFCLLPKTFLFS